MNDITKKTKEAKIALDKARTKRAELTGRRKQLLETLGTKWGIGTVEEAEKRIETLEVDIEEKEEQLRERVSDLDDMMAEMKNGNSNEG